MTDAPDRVEEVRLICDETLEGVRDGRKPVFCVDVVDWEGVRRERGVGFWNCEYCCEDGEEEGGRREACLGGNCEYGMADC